MDKMLEGSKYYLDKKNFRMFAFDKGFDYVSAMHACGLSDEEVQDIYDSDKATASQIHQIANLLGVKPHLLVNSIQFGG